MTFLNLNTRLQCKLLIIIVLFSGFTRLAAQPAAAQVPPPTPQIIPVADSMVETELQEVWLQKPGNLQFPEMFKQWQQQTLDHIDQFATNRRDYVLRMFEKGKKFFPGIEKTLSHYGLPTELKVLVPLESAFRANAVSVAGAVGYWQIMDGTAGEYGLSIITAEERNAANPVNKKKETKGKKQTAKTADIKKTAAVAAAKPVKKPRKKADDRCNLRKSTLTAARYLRDRFKNLNNDLLLVVASYNYGIGNIWETMKASGIENPTFWDIKDMLPKETRLYVMNFITLNVLFSNQERLRDKTLSCKTQTVKGLAWVASNATGKAGKKELGDK